MDSKVDIIVLGATGFTGKHAVKNLALLTKNSEFSDLKWGIAGRSKEKLKNLLSELEEMDVEISKVPTLECDILKEGALLPSVTGRARVLVNATGPHTLLSGPVVEACIQTGTQYVDISAELFHMLNIYRLYHKRAEQAGVLIVPACGFDCIPALAGLIYLERNFEGTLQSVECYNVLDIPKKAYFPGPNKCLLHYGTWESMIHEMHTFRQYQVLKKETFGEPDPAPEGINRRFFHRHKGRFWCPYPGPDRGVVEMYQHYQKERGETPYHFRSYVTMPLFIHFFIIVPVFFIYYLMSYVGCLRRLLWKYPRVFTLGYVSHKGPSKEMREGLKFSFTLIGKGWAGKTDLKSEADKSVTVKVSGNDPGYRTTSMALILSAITILQERAKMPIGGVLTTGTVFRGTNIIEKLQKHCMKFEIIENIDQHNSSSTPLSNFAEDPRQSRPRSEVPRSTFAEVPRNTFAEVTRLASWGKLAQGVRVASIYNSIQKLYK